MQTAFHRAARRCTRPVNHDPPDRNSNPSSAAVLARRTDKELAVFGRATGHCDLACRGLRPRGYLARNVTLKFLQALRRSGCLCLQ